MKIIFFCVCACSLFHTGWFFDLPMNLCRFNVLKFLWYSFCSFFLFASFQFFYYTTNMRRFWPEIIQSHHNYIYFSLFRYTHTYILPVCLSTYRGYSFNIRMKKIEYILRIAWFQHIYQKNIPLCIMLC